MMKYILSILLCIFLMWGLGGSTPEKGITEFRTEVSNAAISQSTGHLPFFNDESSVDYKISDCILSQLSNAKESGAFKTLKLRQSTTPCLLNASRTEHSEETANNRSFNGNFLKYSCGYYVYTLKHILI